jgi:tryptophan synthase alpha chain
MSRLKPTFDRLKAEDRTALVTYIVAGDPDLSTSLELLKSLPAAGSDVIELGMPFTDPVADGPAIQAGALRALAAGTTVKKTLAMLTEFRKGDQTTPVVLMGYFNPVYVYGCEAFARDAAAAGADGLIIVDLPPEEDTELRVPANKMGIDLIRLLTPTATSARIETLVENASGFLYYVSVAGITGQKSAAPDAVAKHLALIREKTSLPIAVGFGIRTPEDAKAMAAHGDAVVVGSRFVDMISKADKNQCVSEVSGEVRRFAGGLR